MAALKYSRQRESIKEFLRSRTDHPTADTVYENLRQIYPNISLGTVYRNLSLLSDIGEIRKLTNFGSADRYDGRVALTFHVYEVQPGDRYAVRQSQWNSGAGSRRICPWQGF